MSDWKDTIRSIAPTIASALGGPMAGAAAAAVGSLLGMSNATVADVSGAIDACQLTPSAISKLRELELQYQAEERERGFRYADLEFRDRADARDNNVKGGTQRWLFGLSLLLLAVSLGTQVAVLFTGYSGHGVPDVVVGRILGQMDAVAITVLAYWYGTSSGSAQKSELLAQSSKPM